MTEELDDFFNELYYEIVFNTMSDLNICLFVYRIVAQNGILILGQDFTIETNSAPYISQEYMRNKNLHDVIEVTRRALQNRKCPENLPPRLQAKDFLGFVGNLCLKISQDIKREMRQDWKYNKHGGSAAFNWVVNGTFMGNHHKRSLILETNKKVVYNEKDMKYVVGGPEEPRLKDESMQAISLRNPYRM